MGDLTRFEDTLVSVLENQPERSEVVVVLNQPYDDPYQLQGEVKFVETLPGADLVDCFACGLAASHGPVVHVIAAGYEVTPGWADAALARFAEPDVAAVVPVVVDREHPDRILFAGLRWTAAGSIGRIAAGERLQGGRGKAESGPPSAFPLPPSAFAPFPSLAAAFYRRDVLERVDILQHDGSELTAATDLALAVRKAGYRLVQEPACVTIAAGELLADPAPGWKLHRSGCRVPRDAWREGVASERLFRRWAAVPGWRRSAAAHLGLVAMECARFPWRPSILARLSGRLWARLGFGAPRRVAIGRQAACSADACGRRGGESPSPAEQSSEAEAVLRPHQFGPVDARQAIPSRAAG